MKVLRGFLGGLVILAVLGFFGFWVYTDVNYDKSAVQYIKQEIQERKDKKTEEVKDEVSGDETVAGDETLPEETTGEEPGEEELVVENEDGTVQATMSINF